MTSSAIYSNSFSAYTNSQNIEKVLQASIDNINANELLFPNVDYSSTYDTILGDYASNTEGSDADGHDSTSDNTTESGGSGDTALDGGTKATEEQVAQLQAAYQQIQDEQGWVGKAWNGIKNFFGHSNGSNAVEETLAKVESGEISYEAAVEKLNTYSQKQESFVDSFANVVSGLVVAASVIAAPFSFGASLALGAGVGAAVNIAIKASDKASNNIKGDYEFKDGLKDGITGAVGGLVTAATAGIGTAGVVVAKETGKVVLKETIKQGVIAGAKAGAIDGAVMSATNYTTDAIFDGEEFTFDGLVSTTATGAIGGAITGGVVGGVSSGLNAYSYNKAFKAGDLDTIQNSNVVESKVDQDLLSSAKKAKSGSTFEQSSLDELVGTKKSLQDILDDPNLTYSQKQLYKSELKQCESAIRNLQKQGIIDKDFNLTSSNAGTDVAQEVVEDTAENTTKYLARLESQNPVVPEDVLTRLKSISVDDLSPEEVVSTRDELFDLIANNPFTDLERSPYLQKYKQCARLIKQYQNEGILDKNGNLIAQAAEEVVEDATKKAVEEGTEEATAKTFGQMFKGAQTRVKNMFKKAFGNVENLTPKQAKEALAGKFNASRKEIVNAYNQMKATDDYKTNLLFRNFVNDLYQSAISE